MPSRRYELTGTTFAMPGGIILRRIRAVEAFVLADGTTIAAGTLGGFIESMRNLDQSGNTWVFGDGKELVETAKRQLHVGLPIETISEIEMGRASISRRQGFGTPGLIAVPAAHTPAHAPAATPGAFTQRASGLIVPN